ncbi:hypothetical protein CH35J_007426 [Colletotrichum higginsianum]|uniref:Uncharacterized protein n=1 Tax=Colletotrichum higginsianum TaxID=80884 RepID=A0A4T0VVK0_9PEZI|nr:hypothetical protein CH35J_007426 [Colletotrichum higginsianum]
MMPPTTRIAMAKTKIQYLRIHDPRFCAAIGSPGTGIVTYVPESPLIPSRSGFNGGADSRRPLPYSTAE